MHIQCIYPIGRRDPNEVAHTNNVASAADLNQFRDTLLGVHSIVACVILIKIPLHQLKHILGWGGRQVLSSVCLKRDLSPSQGYIGDPVPRESRSIHPLLVRAQSECMIMDLSRYEQVCCV